MTSKRSIQLGTLCAVGALAAYELAIATVSLWADVHATAQPSADQLTGLACALAAWAIVTWLIAASALTIAAAAPGALGLFGRRWAVRIAPLAIRAALGMTLGAAPVVIAQPAVASASATECPADPTIGRPLGSAADTSATRHQAKDRSRAELADAPANNGRDHVTVNTGDSLWSISADHLGKNATVRAISAEWPRWFAANRDEIGPDPNVLQIGTTLTRPPR